MTISNSSKETLDMSTKIMKKAWSPQDKKLGIGAMLERRAKNLELLQLWTEAENELKLRAEAAFDQLDADCPLPTDVVTQAVENTAGSPQNKTWVVGGMLSRRTKNLELLQLRTEAENELNLRAEAAFDQLDAVCPLPTDDIFAQAFENAEALP
jgi:hypothetical protein